VKIILLLHARHEKRVERVIVREREAFPPLDPDQVRVLGTKNTGRLLGRHFAAECPELVQQLLCAVDDLHNVQHSFGDNGWTLTGPDRLVMHFF
jgi:hypothetical protein